MNLPDYQQTDVIGQAWTRAYHVELNNRMDTHPSVTFHKERIVVLPGNERIVTPAGSFTVPFQPGKLIQLRDPSTNQPMEGQFAPHEFVRLLMYSLFWQEAHEYDEREAARMAAEVVSLQQMEEDTTQPPPEPEPEPESPEAPPEEQPEDPPEEQP